MNLKLNDSWDSSVSVVTRQEAGQSGVWIWQQQEIFFLSKEPRLALGPTQPGYKPSWCACRQLCQFSINIHCYARNDNFLWHVESKQRQWPDWADHNRWPQHFTSIQNFHGVRHNYRKRIALLYVIFEVLTALLLKILGRCLCIWWDGSWCCRPFWHLHAEGQGEGPMTPYNVWGPWSPMACHFITKECTNTLRCYPTLCSKRVVWWEVVDSAEADHISTDTKHFMSKMCFQLQVWN